MATTLCPGAALALASLVPRPRIREDTSRRDTRSPARSLDPHFEHSCAGCVGLCWLSGSPIRVVWASAHGPLPENRVLGCRHPPASTRPSEFGMWVSVVLDAFPCLIGLTKPDYNHGFVTLLVWVSSLLSGPAARGRAYLRYPIEGVTVLETLRPSFSTLTQITALWLQGRS